MLAIAGMLVSGMWPSMTAMVDRSRGISAINRIVTHVRLARHTAVNRRALTTVCAEHGEGRCGGQWHEAIIVFTDHNANARIDGRDVLVRRESGGSHGTVRWRAFGNKPYLQFTPLGYTNHHNGNFVYCPPGGDATRARQAVISIPGRIRVVHYRDAAGMPVDRLGRPLRC